MSTVETGAQLWAESMLRACCQGGLFILLVWSVCRLFPRLPAGARCWLWWLASMKLLLGLVWLSPVPLAVLPAEPAPPPVPARVLTHQPTVGGAVMGSHAAAGPARQGAGLRVHEATPFRRVPLEPAVVLLGVWMAAILFRFCRVAGHLAAVRRLLRRSVPASTAWIGEQAAQLAAALRLRRAPVVRESAAAPGPLVAGLVRPVVLLPEGAAERFSAAELRLALAHELAHVARRDLLLSLVPHLAQTLFFFHPLAWLARREWEANREAACDALALQATGARPVEYGRLLLKLVAAHRLPHPAAALGATTGYQTYHRRIKMLSQIATPTRRRWRLGLTALVALGAAGAIPWRLIARAAPAAPAAAADPKMQACKEQLHTIGQAVQAYRKEHGELPAQLSDLFPRYISDLKLFHCPADMTVGSPRRADDYNDMAAPPVDTRPVSYAYYMSPEATRVSFGHMGGSRADRSWRAHMMANRQKYGDRVPLARCWHHASSQFQTYSQPLVLSLTLDGTVYQGRGNWQMEPESIAVVVEQMERDLNAGPGVFRRQWSPGPVAHEFAHVAMEEDPAFQQERKRLMPDYVPPGQRLLPLHDRLRSLAGRVEALRPTYPASVSQSDRLAMVGALYDMAGDTERAAAAYEAVVARIKAGDPIHQMGEIAVKQRLPTLYSSRGQHEKAIAVHQRFLQKEPQDWMGYIQIAREYEAMGQHEKALELRRKWDPSGLLRGKPAPDFTMNDAAGRPVAMAKLRGQVVVLFFSHGAYPRFREVTRELDTLQRKYADQGLSVITLARGADKATAASQVPKDHAFPLLLGADQVYARYGVTDSAMLYIVGRGGNVAHIYLGYGMDLGAERWVEDESRKLLAIQQASR